MELDSGGGLLPFRCRSDVGHRAPADASRPSAANISRARPGFTCRVYPYPRAAVCCVRPSGELRPAAVQLKDRCPGAAYFTTVVSVVAALFDLSGSGAELPTRPVFVITPRARGVTVIVTVALAPGASVPSAQSTCPFECMQPADALSKVTSAGSVSRSRASGAALGPLLVASRV